MRQGGTDENDPDGLLDHIDDYLDAVPRGASRVEQVGPFTLFVSTTSWPYYARPRRDLRRRVDPADVAAALARQAELAVPQTFEWVVERTPSMADAAQAAGLAVDRYPLLVLDPAVVVHVPAPAGVRIEQLGPDDPALAAALAVQRLGFAAAGTAVGTVGVAERDASALPMDLSTARANVRAGRTVVVAAADAGGPLCVGMHQPVAGPRGVTTEIVGVATLPAARRRGLGSAVTAALVADARTRGAELVFLSAGGDDVARVYERVGFRRVGHAGAAEPGRAGGG